MKEKQEQATLDLIHKHTHSITRKLDTMADQFDDLRNSVTQLTSVSNSAVALLNDISAKLAAALASGDVSGSIAALKADIDSDTQALANAVAANTPATPAV